MQSSKSPSYPAPDGQSSRRSEQRPNSVEVPKLDSTPGPPSPNPHPPRRAFAARQSPIFYRADLACTKFIIHALKYEPETVNGVLLGLVSVPVASIVIVNTVPLQRQCVTGCYTFFLYRFWTQFDGDYLALFFTLPS
jgi:hypothetical protein